LENDKINCQKIKSVMEQIIAKIFSFFWNSVNNKSDFIRGIEFVIFTVAIIFIIWFLKDKISNFRNKENNNSKNNTIENETLIELRDKFSEFENIKKLINSLKNVEEHLSNIEKEMKEIVLKLQQQSLLSGNISDKLNNIGKCNEISRLEEKLIDIKEKLTEIYLKLKEIEFNINSKDKFDLDE
jgi:hypothetical protein